MTAGFDYFVVFAEMRTGSNFLETNLNALDGVTCYGEAFNPNFIGYPKTEDILGVTQQMRDEDPRRLIQAIRSETSVLGGFRYFNDHDPRVLDEILNDPRCAKIILTRNPAESYVSLKIAVATGQWKLTNMKRRKDSKAVFDADEFDAHIDALQSFQLTLLNRLQRNGQTAFYVAYEDLQDVEVINGLARYLSIPDQLDSLDKTLKVQNPASLSEKVENYDAMEKALGGIDRYNLTRTPNFEPRRTAAVPTYVATQNAPLLYLPIQGGPTAAVETWLTKMDGTEPDALLRQMNQKTLRQWKRAHSGHRSFTVLRHPLVRAHAVFCEKILTTGSGAYPKIRRALVRDYKLELPTEPTSAEWTDQKHYDAFMGFLEFLKGNLSGQTAIRIDPAWCTQSAVVQGFADFMIPDMILREDALSHDLPDLADRIGCAAYDYSASDLTQSQNARLAAIYDQALEKTCQSAYQRDYMMFGFSAWNAAS